jgi:hypothetical protein
MNRWLDERTRDDISTLQFLQDLYWDLVQYCRDTEIPLGEVPHSQRFSQMVRTIFKFTRVD